jgi:hypothetical protein
MDKLKHAWTMRGQEKAATSQKNQKIQLFSECPFNTAKLD